MLATLTQACFARGSVACHRFWMRGTKSDKVTRRRPREQAYLEGND